MPTPLRVLILEDRPADAELMVRELRQAGFDPHWQRVEAEPEYCAHLDPALDVILADYKLPQFDAVRALQRVQERGLDIPFIVVSGAISEEVAVACMKQGAADYLFKDRLARLGPAVAQALDQHRLRGARRRAGEALRLSEEHFRRTFDQSPIGAAIVTLDYRFQRVNAALCQITGYSEDELLSPAFPDITHPGDLAADVQSAQRLAAGEIDQYQMDKRYIRKDGGIVWIHLSVRMMRDAAGRPLYFLPMMEDITERKRAEESLHQHTRRLEALHEIDRTILAARSPETIGEFALRHICQLVPCQGASLVLFDFEADEAIVLAAHGISMTGLGDVAHFPLQAFGITEELRQGKVYIAEDLRNIPQPISVMQTLQAEGLRSYINVPLISQGQLIGSLNLGADGPDAFAPEHVDIAREVADQLAIAIQQARLYEQVQRHAAELKQKVEERTKELQAANARLEEASRHKSEFLANMSHELRTPLSSVIGFSDLLLEQIVGPLNQEQARYMTNIQNSGNHLLQLSSDILDLSKVEAGKLVLQPQPLPVAATLEDILVLARGLAHKKAQTVEAQIDPELPPLQADPVRFKQILFNLLSNAIKFTPDGGRVTVSARRVPSPTSQVPNPEPGTWNLEQQG